MSEVPVRTYSQTHPEAGYLEFSIPLMNPEEVEVYLREKAEKMNAADSFLLINDLTKIATDMWNGHALWVGDPDQARLQLREDSEVKQWLSTSP